MSYPRNKRPVVLSNGIVACNEETSIRSTLESSFRQTVFDRRQRRFFGHLFPGVLRLRPNLLPGWRRIKQIPEAGAGFVLTVIACLRAHRLLRARSTGHAARPTSEAVLSETDADSK
jgi:hypothetical protein